MKFLLFFLFCCFGFNFSQNVYKVNIYQDQLDYSDKGGNLLKGWLKFFTYEQKNFMENLPTKFEFNPAYSDKRYLQNQSDEWGSLNIPSDTSFFFMLTKTSLYVANSRIVFLSFFLENIFLRMIYRKHIRVWRLFGFCLRK